MVNEKIVGGNLIAKNLSVKQLNELLESHSIVRISPNAVVTLKPAQV